MSEKQFGKNNLYQKIQLVANDVRNISKNMQVGNGSYGYKAVSDIDVTLKVKDAEKKHGLVSIPTKQELINQEVIRTGEGNGKEKITYSFLLKMTTRIIDVDNPNYFIDIESFGHGLDSGDKGFGKASTYARKYGLLNAYKIATGEDPDHNKSKTIVTNKTISDKRVAVYNVMAANKQALDAVLLRYGVDNIDDLSDDQIEKQYTAWVRTNHIKE